MNPDTKEYGVSVEIGEPASAQTAPRTSPATSGHKAPAPQAERAQATRKVGLLEHMGGGNLGDDATVDAVMQNIRSRWPEAVIYGFSMNADDTRERHKIPAYPIRCRKWSWEEGRSPKPAVKESIKTALEAYPRLLKLAKAMNRMLIRGPRSIVQEVLFLGRSFKILRPFELLVISGGGQLTEAWGGPWSFPYTLFKWSLLARLRGVKCYYINVGAGPLKRPISRFFVNRALRLADYVSFRDEDSRALVESLGYRKRAEVAPDCAYGLTAPVLRKSTADPVRGAVIGFSPMAYCDPRFYWEKNQPLYDLVRHNLVLFGSWLNRQGYKIRLFSTDIWFDATVIEEVETALKNAAGVTRPEWIAREQISDVQELLAKMNAMDYIVTCRYHGVVFAHMLGKPMLALSHHPKVTTLMESLGLSEYCIDIRACDPGILEEKFARLLRNKNAITDRLQQSLAGNKTALAKQFDNLFGRRFPDGER